MDDRFGDEVEHLHAVHQLPRQRGVVERDHWLVGQRHAFGREDARRAVARRFGRVLWPATAVGRRQAVGRPQAGERQCICDRHGCAASNGPGAGEKTAAIEGEKGSWERQGQW